MKLHKKQLSNPQLNYKSTHNIKLSWVWRKNDFAHPNPPHKLNFRDIIESLFKCLIRHPPLCAFCPFPPVCVFRSPPPRVTGTLGHQNTGKPNTGSPGHLVTSTLGHLDNWQWDTVSMGVVMMPTFHKLDVGCSTGNSSQAYKTRNSLWKLLVECLSMKI